MNIVPQRFAVKFNPPRLCLIYEINGEALYHDFPLSPEDLYISTKDIYERLIVMNPGYLDNIDAKQVCSLIEKIKKSNQPQKKHGKSSKKQEVKKEQKHDPRKDQEKKGSSVAKFRNMFDDLGISNQSEDSSEGSEFDFNEVDRDIEKDSESDL